MTEHGVTESVVEQAALAWLESAGWQVGHDPDIAPESPGAERASYAEVVLERRLRDALARLSPNLSAEALEEAYRRLTRVGGQDLVARNRPLHRLLRPDVMLFAHGLPLALQELENAADGASIRPSVQKPPGAARRAG